MTQGFDLPLLSIAFFSVKSDSPQTKRRRSAVSKAKLSERIISLERRCLINEFGLLRLRDFKTSRGMRVFDRLHCISLQTCLPKRRPTSDANVCENSNKKYFPKNLLDSKTLLNVSWLPWRVRNNIFVIFHFLRLSTLVCRNSRRKLVHIPDLTYCFINSRQGEISKERRWEFRAWCEGD